MFSSLPDPRASNTRHRLSDVMFIALAASLCGAQSAVDAAKFARSKRGLLESFLGPFDAPSHDTFSRLLRRLDPEAFGQALPASAMSPRSRQCAIAVGRPDGCSLHRALGAGDMLAVTRAHWSVENSLHWSLDVIFGEDQLRARKDHAPANIALINRLAKTLLERIDDPKTSIRQRIKKCAWENKYLTKAISHMR